MTYDIVCKIIPSFLFNPTDDLSFGFATQIINISAWKPMA
jgi:hypothetical protein